MNAPETMFIFVHQIKMSSNKTNTVKACFYQSRSCFVNNFRCDRWEVLLQSVDVMIHRALILIQVVLVETCVCSARWYKA